MNVLLVSQCSKRALTETRRILDQFAERRGERTWQTAITQAGLDALRRLLRKTARKNTAVACHWIRGQDHSELLWIVGNARQFNVEGAVPTNTTVRNVRRAEDESAWHRLPLMTALAALAALMHDLGKAMQAFQDRLCNPALRERNHYRHEWVSVRLFQAFVGTDDDAGWLQRLAACADGAADVEAFEALWLDHAGGRLIRDGLDTDEAQDGPHGTRNPFRCLPPLAQAVAWLVLTHHRLPCTPVRRPPNYGSANDGEQTSAWRRFGSKPSFINRDDLRDILAQVHADWNEPRDPITAAKLESYWFFPHGLPVSQPAWRKQAARYARKLQELASLPMGGSALHDPFAMHVSRLCLMLADHHYSSISDEARRKPYLSPGYPVYANTRRDGPWLPDRRGKPVFNQTLDEHLLGVQAHATLVARSLPTLAHSLPALQHHKGLKRRSRNARFQWQDGAADLAASVRDRSARQGAFIVNMASTGCGKTLGNARVMNALANPATGMRCAFAIGLRTLTLQTGRVFQNDLGLDDDELAIQVGGAANRALFEYWEQQAEASGSASSQALLYDPPLRQNEGDFGARKRFNQDGLLLYEGDDRHPLLQRLTDDTQVRRLLAAPLLVCTVDHLTPATESLRGGRQIAPMLRLMTGDLVLDEPDDFDMADLPTLTRLVHWAGLLGARVLLSSATLPPALVEGLFLSYRAGRAVFQRHRSERPDEPVNVCCLWIDEFRQDAHDCADGVAFRAHHADYAAKRVARLAADEVRRRARIAPLPPGWSGMDEAERRADFARFVLRCAWELHQMPQNHGTPPGTARRVSFGLIRMANIEPLFDVALAMYAPGAPAPGVRVHLCVYHSQFPLLARSVIEHHLDTVLDRRPLRDGSDPAWQRPEIRAAIDAFPERDHLFIVLGSPVTEVGRDHDYDWAVVEPSSMRSLIQLAGRVRRHRPGAVDGVNVLVLNSNLRAFEQLGKAAFCKPGFEMDSTPDRTDTARYFHLRTHDLQSLLAKHTKGAAAWPIDARARIVVDREGFNPAQNLVDLEHARMHDAMLARPAGGPNQTPVRRDASLCWASRERLWLTGLLPQFQRFRDDSRRDEDVAFLLDDEEDELRLYRVRDGQRRGQKEYRLVDEYLLRPVHLAAGPGITPWARADLRQELVKLAGNKGLPLLACAEQYATATLPESTQGWRYNEALGFTRAK